MEKLYIVTRSDLDPGLLAAQCCHALQAFNDQHPDLVRRWHPGNLVLLAVRDAAALGELASTLTRQRHALACFHEPDVDGSLTAIAVAGTARRALSSLPLALRPRPTARAA
jgi:hypothetical protein